ncbi:MAG: glutamate--cysteine ligase [Betaproteobacteria bacterium]|nr:glutamate--cysteine ligase [Betaproteobacteria bacterium]
MKPRRAFSGYGVELEYMIVDRLTLAVRPMADALLRDARGRVVNELPRGRLGWSNELTAHLVEIKNLGPAPDLAPLAADFQAEVRAINRRLESSGARLMPTGMHPWMDPARECRLWSHGHADIYRAYDRIFGCRQQGFANIQSVHLNLPFADDAEFARLHAAVRLLLPLLPALAASSPIARGSATGQMDSRLDAYLTHQARVPATQGRVIPDTVSSQAEYREGVLEPMYRAIAPLDPEGTLRHEWLNARGAIPRFERMALEIRLLDMQEHPGADLAVAAAVAAAAHRLYRAGEGGGGAGLAAQQAWPTETLAALLRACLRDADETPVEDPAYLGLLGLPAAPCRAGEVWRRLIEDGWAREPAPRPAWSEALGVILERGPLARRILRAAGPQCPRARQEEIYRSLCDCLDRGCPFEG